MRATLNSSETHTLRAFRALFIVSVAAITAAGCRPVSVIPDPDDGSNIPGPTDEQTVSIAMLKTLYSGAPTLITDELRIAGAVISSDRHGNFHNTLVLDDGTAGIEVRIEVDELFKLFMIHTRAAVRCNGLWLGSYGGTLQLGAAPFGDYEVQPLSATEAAEHIAADTEFYGEVRPLELTFDKLSARHISAFVAFSNVAFVGGEHSLSWADTSPTTDGGDPPAYTDRHIIDEAGNTLAVRTSRHATFASWPLPSSIGRIEGVLNIFGNDYQLIVNDSEAFIPNAD